MDRLKAETRAAHEATEAVPFMGALLRGALPRGRYVAQLFLLSFVHRALELALRNATENDIRAVWRDYQAKSSLLEQDLDQLGCDDIDAPEPALTAASECIGKISARNRRHPVSLLGYLYVLEGSTLGGMVLRPRIQAALALPDERGLAYYGAYGKDTKARWVEFRSRMNELSLDEATQDEIIRAASECFEAIGSILRALSEGLIWQPQRSATEPPPAAAPVA